MTNRTLAEWLQYQTTLTVHAIELGLDRIGSVWCNMGAPAPGRIVVTVTGTNGKGSTVAMLDACLRAMGLRTGCYTSPYLHRYNEQIRIIGNCVDDEQLVAAFERIDACRAAIPLTGFEFATLAAFDLMARADLDVTLLEVGMGGRTDAVNIVDADVAVITTVDLDHLAWLGQDRNSIGREKGGIARRGRPAVVGEHEPPQGLLDELSERGAVPVRRDIQYRFDKPTAQGWRWHHADGTTLTLPLLPLEAPVQYDNAACVIATLHALRDALLRCRHERGEAVEAGTFAVQFSEAIAAGLQSVRIPGRLQRIKGEPDVVVDVGHNPQAALALADWLRTSAYRRVRAVYGALTDKDVEGVVRALGPLVAEWHLIDLSQETPRGMPMGELFTRVRAAVPRALVEVQPDVASAIVALRKSADAGDCILTFGSFFVAKAALSTVDAE
ncbi:FolC bifunctional protein [Burkholderia ambifaria IOP40-10]|uniref:Dihydrofolate synthase/folylpolyglutamate synthase n=1 Tax=Burkholderia ambifaria IOP40-10 TaxID=396596 RepID=B1FP43_9BURK|nr:folylpolyglutamate synthase/dihydrofolate synthase family protein [Burkholderia ambifaria]EDT00681.1 FolC bifunctional protein [Burkholderia ambifaria IOP40-10]